MGILQGWGARIIDRLSFDLREQFPEMKGFSPRNLKYMRAFAAALLAILKLIDGVPAVAANHARR